MSVGSEVVIPLIAVALVWKFFVVVVFQIFEEDCGACIKSYFRDASSHP